MVSCSKLEYPQDIKTLEKVELYNILSGLFHYPLYEASLRLNLGKTDFKKICRKAGILRWPYRKSKNTLSGKDRTFPSKFCFGCFKITKTKKYESRSPQMITQQNCKLNFNSNLL